MTDDMAPDGAGTPAPLDPVTGRPVPQPVSDEPPSPAVAATAKPPGRMRAVIVIGAIVAFLAIVLFVVRNNVSADDLKVGDCFVIPNGTSIQTVEHHPCNESHNAEVVLVKDYDGATYPISLSLDSFIESNCVPAFETYVGRAVDSEPELTIGYFYPSRDSWDSGDRTIICYVALPDESPMTESVKG